MTLIEASLITLTYVFYVLTVFYIYYINNSNNTAFRGAFRGPSSLSSSSSSSSSSSLSTTVGKNCGAAASDGDGDEESTLLIADPASAANGSSRDSYLYNDSAANIAFKTYATRPIVYILNLSIPPLKNRAGEVSVARSLLAMAMCVVCISVLTTLVVYFCSLLVAHLNIDNSTIGATLVALGSEIPDTISSVALARSGYFDAAMAGAIGSQVINISLGVGLPALLLCLASSDFRYSIDRDMTSSLWLLCSLLIIVVFCYVCATLPVYKVLTCDRLFMARGTSLDRKGAAALLAVFAGVYFVFVYSNEA